MDPSCLYGLYASYHDCLIARHCSNFYMTNDEWEATSVHIPCTVYAYSVYTDRVSKLRGNIYVILMHFDNFYLKDSGGSLNNNKTK